MTKKASILIVDDKPNNLITLETTLDELDTDFIRATSGNDALKAILNHNFALAILDVQMPEMDGYELARLIRGREQTRHLPIIFLSAVFLDDYHIFKGYESGAVDFIAKPYDPKILINKIKVFLQLYKQKQELQESSELYKKTFDAIKDVIMIQDESMRIIRINKAGCDLLNLPEEHITGKHCYELFHGTDTPCDGCQYQDCSHTTLCRTWDMHHSKINKDFSESVSKIKSDDDKNNLYVHVAHDITEQRQMKEQLLQAEKLEAVGTLAGGIAHDFNNILAAILGYTDISLMSTELPPTISENLQQIKKAGIRAKELVAQILTFSRKSDLKPYPVFISPIIKEALKLLRATIPQTVEFKTSISVDREKIIANPIELHQIIMNLCTNSFQALENERGIIDVRLQTVTIDNEEARQKNDISPGDYLQLSISDTGKGIDPKLKERIFEPFFTTKEKGQGTGMGLAVVHGIVNHYGGTITVASEPGKGSLFKMFFPVVEQTGNKEESEPIIAPVGGTGCILLVDDEPSLIELGTKYLQFLGYTSVTAASGQEALTIFKEKSADFAAVLTDQTMPGLPGNLLAKELMQIRPDIPVILCTGHSSTVSKEEALKAGIKAYLMKPIALKSLADCLNRVIKHD